MKFLDLAWQRSQIEPELSRALDEVMQVGSYVNGPAVEAFESAFAKYIKTKYCVACANGTDALELILEGLGIGSGDDVLVPAMTFVATSEAVFRTGAKPVLVDVDSAAVLDLEQVVASLTARTRAVIPVHLYGYPVDIEGLRQRLDGAGRDDVFIVEDAAQGHGASRRGCSVGSLGDAASFSFYPGKNLGAFGDAGAVTTSDPLLAEHLRRISNHGRLEKFDHEIVGRNSRMDSIQAAVLSVKLKYLDQWVARRREIADRYLHELSGLRWLRLPAVPEDGLHGWHQFAIEVLDRETMRQYLDLQEIPTGIHYPKSLADFSFHDDSPVSDYPRAMALAKHELSLPIGEHLTDDEVEYIIRALKAYIPTE